MQFLCKTDAACKFQTGHVFPQIVCKMIDSLHGSIWIFCNKGSDDIEGIEKKVGLDLAQHHFYLLPFQLGLCSLFLSFYVYDPLFLDIEIYHKDT